MLDQLGIDYIEGGYPGANATDTEFFAGAAEARQRHVHRLRHDQARRPLGVERSGLPGDAAVAGAGAICLVAKAWDYHVRVALGITNEENLEGVIESVKAVRASAANRKAMIDCEHFFDGYKANRAYALAVARAAYEAGARWVVLCDTNGGTLPHEIERIVADGQASFRARISASTPTTIPRTRSPTRWPPCAPACARSRARSTASVSAAATPT